MFKKFEKLEIDCLQKVIVLKTMTISSITIV